MSETAKAPEDQPASAELSELVFVYGGLRYTCPEAFRMIGGKYLRLGEVAGTLLQISGTAALVPRRGRERGWVTGELFEVSPEHLGTLDATAESSDENGGSNYRRVRMQVYLPGSPVLQGEAWVWQWIGPATSAPIVRSGDWMDMANPRPFPLFTFIAGLCLVGFVGSLVGIDSVFPAMGAVPRYRRLLIFCVAMVPVAACVSAWWGLRRRERYELLSLLVMIVAGLVSLPLGMSIAVEISRWFIGLF